VTADEQVIWPALADLFFLDTEHEPYWFQSTAQLLKDRGWSRQQVEHTLIALVAPVAGANLGYLLWPIVAGEWAGFDPDWLNERIDRLQRRRAQSPRWHFFLSDLCCRRMLKKLEWERLLDLLV
jgi:hypothetical protein